MKEISIGISEAQILFMMELLQKFDFVKINKSFENVNMKLTERQIKSIGEGRAKSK